MKEFYIRKKLPSIFVDKQLIEQIEEYILNDIPEIIGVDKEIIEGKYSLEIVDYLGTEKFSKISDYPLSIFQNGTSKITLGFSLYENIYSVVNISLGVNKYYSELDIKLKAQNPREKSQGIYNGILDRLSPNKTYNSFFHRLTNGPILAIGVVLLVLSFTLFMDKEILWGFYSLIGGISLITFDSRMERIKPYSEFRTQKQLRFNQENSSRLCLGV